MQMGARWAVGGTPHRGVPPELHETIAVQEARFPSAGSWTLTWLEGRPRCALDDLVLVSLDAAGAVVVRELAPERAPSGIREDEAGVTGRGTGAGPGTGAGAVAGAGTDDDDDDDDDWLS